jgi:hypothetical protein
MDKKEFCDQMAVKLRDFDRLLQLQRHVAPATAEKGLQQHQQHLRREEARPRVEALRGQLDVLCAGAAPLTNALKSEFEQRITEITELMR